VRLLLRAGARIGIAADHPMQHDHVGRLDGVGIDRDVVQPPLHATLEAGLPQESRSSGSLP
jgi:hypothetical protein